VEDLHPNNHDHNPGVSAGAIIVASVFVRDTSRNNFHRSAERNAQSFDVSSGRIKVPCAMNCHFNGPDQTVIYREKPSLAKEVPEQNAGQDKFSS
jgi:hypothetical protein